jgi:hypothetical protein
MLGEKRHSRLFGTLQVTLLVLLTGCATAQGLNGSRYPITERDIAKELDVVGIDVDASQIHLPVHMDAADASPKLEIVTAQPLRDSQLRLELRCPTTSVCLPFLAMLDVKDANLVSAAIRLKIGSANTSRQRMASQGGAQVDQELRGSGVSAREDRPRLKVGSRAVLEMRDGHMEIHIQVLAIDSGSIGQQVRVCTLDRKKVFQATVTGEGTVTGVMK